MYASGNNNNDMVVCLQDSVRSIVCSVIGRLACVGRRATRLHYREGLLQRSLLSALQVNMINRLKGSLTSLTVNRDRLDFN